ncbi:MAG: putative metal-dependent enzyme (double-stranded beta helix superfamily) [Cognaticolwellia sp.]|jgi:predicted metal-dependent enzyme (double-stranded beta helix superfamily)
MFAQLLTDPEPSWPFSEKEPDWSVDSVAPRAGTPYGRRILHTSSAGEVLLLQWAAGIATAPHDHGGARGWVRVLQGRIEEQRYSQRGQGLHPHGWRLLAAGDVSVELGAGCGAWWPEC